VIARRTHRDHGGQMLLGRPKRAFDKLEEQANPIAWFAKLQ
jgi:hypothetical protein